MATHYTSSSRGPVEITGMQYDHAKSAHAKLLREDGDPDVIASLAEHIASVESTFEDRDNG